jgi:4-amino-4-deoxy-L-arabinose transferase-like glycosyltransferase
MFQRLHHRAGHYALLLLVGAGLFLVNLGGPSLWDIDEGHNAEAAREMMAADNWVIPTFNFELRVDKPALLYWLQIGAYRLFGITEFAARFPSALAALLTVLLAYELGRSMFGPAAGLLAGLMLASAPLLAAAAHFANPDALLLACTTLTLLQFWRGYTRTGRVAFVQTGVSSGLAVLAKGPVGLVLPLGVIGLFLLWSGQFRRLFDRRLLLGVLAFSLVALPWYGWVGAETKGEFLRRFFFTHNVGRYLGPMENHGGPFFYYVLVLLAGFAPWSVFFGPALWYAVKALRVAEGFPSPAVGRPTFRFLWCWIGVYLVFFSLGGTKLPNYILPLYPPTALLSAYFLDGWRRGLLQAPPWVLKLSLASLALVGVAIGLGLVVAGGLIPLPALRARSLSGLEAGACAGLLPVAAAAGAWWCLRRDRRAQLLAVFTMAAVLLIGFLGAWGGAALNGHKAPRGLAEMVHAHQTEPDIRISCYRYYQPSLVFYAGRKVAVIHKEQDALDFLQGPLPVYLFLPAPVWEALRHKVDTPLHVLGQRRDLYRNCEVVVVTNR